MDFQILQSDRSHFHASQAATLEDQWAVTTPPENASVADLITLVVIARAAAVRPTDYALADEYLRLACVGHLKPAVYAAVLGQAG